MGRHGQPAGARRAHCQRPAAAGQRLHLALDRRPGRQPGADDRPDRGRSRLPRDLPAEGARRRPGRDAGAARRTRSHPRDRGQAVRHHRRGRQDRGRGRPALSGQRRAGRPAGRHHPALRGAGWHQDHDLECRIPGSRDQQLGLLARPRLCQAPAGRRQGGGARRAAARDAGFQLLPAPEPGPDRLAEWPRHDRLPPRDAGRCLPRSADQGAEFDPRRPQDHLRPGRGGPADPGAGGHQLRQPGHRAHPAPPARDRSAQGARRRHRRGEPPLPGRIRAGLPGRHRDRPAAGLAAAAGVRRPGAARAGRHVHPGLAGPQPAAGRAGRGAGRRLSRVLGDPGAPDRGAGRPRQQRNQRRPAPAPRPDGAAVRHRDGPDRPDPGRGLADPLRQQPRSGLRPGTAADRGDRRGHAQRQRARLPRRPGALARRKRSRRQRRAGDQEHQQQLDEARSTGSASVPSSSAFMA